MNEVAVEQNISTDYRPRGSKEVSAKPGPPKCGGVPFTLELSRINSNVDGNGDTFISNTDAMLAAIKYLKRHNTEATSPNYRKKR